MRAIQISLIVKSKGGGFVFAKLVAHGTKSSVLNAGTCYNGWFPDWTCINNGYQPQDGWGLCDRFGITTH